MGHILTEGMKHPLVTAIVLNYRSHRDTVKCVQALLEQTIADQMEILVTDNHSDDESMGFIRAHLRGNSAVTIVENRSNIGYGAGNNAAVRQAKGEYLLIVNPDNVLPRDGIEAMLTYLQEHPDTGIVGPALVYPDGTVRPSARPFPTPADLFRKRMNPTKWHQEFERARKTLEKKDAVDVDWMVGACLLLKTELFRKLGGFDERFFLFFEDIDICRRIHDMGLRVVYLPKIKVLDRKGRLSGSSMFSLLSRKTTRIHAASAVKYFLKWGLSSAPKRQGAHAQNT